MLHLVNRTIREIHLLTPQELLKIKEIKLRETYGDDIKTDCWWVIQNQRSNIVRSTVVVSNITVRRCVFLIYKLQNGSSEIRRIDIVACWVFLMQQNDDISWFDRICHFMRFNNLIYSRSQTSCSCSIMNFAFTNAWINHKCEVLKHHNIEWFDSELLLKRFRLLYYIFWHLLNTFQ